MSATSTADRTLCYGHPQPMGYLDGDAILEPELKPARSYIAKAVSAPTGNGYLAQFAAPGLIPDYVRDRGKVVVFSTEEDGEIAASLALTRALKSRVRAPSGKPETYRKLTNEEFAVALAEAGITPTFFAFIYGTSQDRVLKWIDGLEDVPHPARVVLAIFKQLPSAIDIAEQVTDSVTQRRGERRNP